MHNIRTWIAVAALASVSACASTQSQHHRGATVSSATGDVVAAAEGVPVRVSNHNWSDIVVYVLHDGLTSRLAQVTAGRSLSVPLKPRHIGSMGTLRLAVHPIGGSSDYTSESLSLRTGNTVRLTVESRVSHSSVAVW